MPSLQTMEDWSITKSKRNLAVRKEEQIYFETSNCSVVELLTATNETL
jgi:hypothetical protein